MRLTSRGGPGRSSRFLARRGHIPARCGRSLGLALLAACAASCALTRPPAEVREAVRVVNRHLPAYVAEANRALETCGPEDRERLQGIGERLALAVATLERWARKKGGGAGEEENTGTHAGAAGDPRATKTPDHDPLPVGTLAPPPAERSQ